MLNPFVAVAVAVGVEISHGCEIFVQKLVSSSCMRHATPGSPAAGDAFLQ
jgi:hypothetical protein